MRGEVQQIGTFEFVDVCLCARIPEAGENRTIGAEGPQGAVIADLVDVLVESIRNREARGCFRLLLRRRDDTTTDRGELRVFVTRLFGRNEGIWTGSRCGHDRGGPAPCCQRARTQEPICR